MRININNAIKIPKLRIHQEEKKTMKKLFIVVKYCKRITQTNKDTGT